MNQTSSNRAVARNENSFFNTSMSLSSLTVYRTGYKQCPKNQHRCKVRDFYLIHYVIKGKGVLKIDTKEYLVSAGESYMMFPGIPVDYTADSEDPWEFCWVGFNGNDAKLLVSASGFSVSNPVLRHGDSKVVHDCIMSIYEARGNARDTIVRMSAYLYLLFAQLIKEAPQRPERNSEVLFQDACAYISRNYKKDISIEDISSAMNVSRSNLYRNFIEFIGVSPKQHLAEFRIHTACKMLANTSMSVKEISTEVGFKNPQHFDVVFKKVMGISPTDFRTNKNTEKSPMKQGGIDK